MGVDPTDADVFRSTLLRRMPPERRLYLAVFVGALMDLKRYAPPTTPSGERLYRTARAWFESEDEHWPVAFVPCCHVLGFDPAAVRERLLERPEVAPTASGRLRTAANY